MQYVGWLAEHGYAASNVTSRVPVLVQFGDFAHGLGATQLSDLPAHVDPFIEFWIARSDHRRQAGVARRELRKEIRGPVEQFLRVTVPGFQGRGRSRRRLTPFVGPVPRFFQYLREERGLRDATLDSYSHHLLRFEEYLRSIQLEPLS